MTDDLVEVFIGLRAHTEPRAGLGGNPFVLACSFDTPATAAQIASAWPDGAVPPELVRVWLTSCRSRLFEDVQCGQWGLLLLSPEEAARRTSEEFARRPAAYRAGDIVIGEFLGDQDLVVLAVLEAGRGRVLIASPLDDRCGWRAVGDSLVEFLGRYLTAHGNKYWE